MRNECNIIRDILPLYIEDMVSQDTVSFVEEHLNGCSVCRTELEYMKKESHFERRTNNPPLLYNNSNEVKKDAVPLKMLKKKMRKRKILTIWLSALSTLLLVFGLCFFLIIYGFQASSSKIDLQTEFQYNEGAYLDQSFVLHIMRLDGLPMMVTVKDIYETDEYGKKILVGYEIVPREVLFNLGQHPGTSTIGYTYMDEDAPSETFDFTITVKFKDKTVVYSMVEEGLFVPQEDVKSY